MKRKDIKKCKKYFKMHRGTFSRPTRPVDISLNTITRKFGDLEIPDCSCLVKPRVEDVEFNEAYLACMGNMMNAMCAALGMPEETIAEFSWNK